MLQPDYSIEMSAVKVKLAITEHIFVDVVHVGRKSGHCCA